MSLLVRMRALLIPGCIALILLIAILAYNFSFLPVQRRYFDDCNLRILKALTDQIRASINAYDKMMDNAESSGVTGATLPAYLASVAPQLAKAEEDESRAVVGDDYGDPPKIAVASDEGTHFLYLAFKHGRSTRYTIRTDFEKLVEKLSPPAFRCPFDAILIAQSDGTVIYQRSASGIAISRINTLDNALVDEKQKKPESLITLDALSQSSSLEHVRIAGTPYRFYSQPLQLPFPMANPQHKIEPGSSGGITSKPWIVCGLVRADRFRSESQAISERYMLWIAAFILLALAAYPFLKLHVSSVTERFRALDVVTVAVSISLAATIAAFILLDVAYWRTRLDQSTNIQMRDLAAAIDSNFENEKKKAFDQLRALYTDRDLRMTLRAAQSDSAPRTGSQLPKLTGSGAGCDPGWACRTEIRSDSKRPKLLNDYPYLTFLTWSDSRGQQRVKWTTRKSVTPFLNLNDGSIPYYPDIRKAFQDTGDSNPVPTEGIGSQYSPNSGDNITIFWKLLDLDGNPVSETASANKKRDLFCASLVTKPISVFDPILPDGFQFAVIKSDGRVVFHSDHTRNLREDFFLETDQDQEVRSRVALRAEGSLVFTYMGRRSRIYIRPMRANTNELWTIVVFRDLRPEQTQNLEIVSLATILFCLYLCCLVIALWLTTYLRRSTANRNWLWPDSRKANTYRLVAVTNVSAGALLLFLSQVAPPLTVIGATIVLPLCVLVFNIAALSGDPPSSAAAKESGGSSPWQWRWAYVSACTTLVAVIAVLPCLPFFRIACDFELKLFAQSGQLKLAADVEDRAGKMRQRYQGPQLAQYADKLLAAPEEETTPYFSYHKALETRIHSGPDYDPPYRATSCGMDGPERQQRCVDLFLSSFSPSYNQVAAGNRFLTEAGSTDRWTWFSTSSLDKRELVLTTREPCRQVLTIASPLTPYVVPWTDWSWRTMTTAFLVFLFMLVRSTAAKIFLLDLVEPVASENPQIECDAVAQRRLFFRRSTPEKLTLVHLAKERLVNPRGRAILCNLLKEGLIERDSGILNIKDPCFADFLRRAVSEDAIRRWEKNGADVRLAGLRTSLLFAGIGVGAFLILSQSNILDTSVTYVTALAALLPACLRVIETLRRGPSG
ncbi:MAG TPA: hypothetical protein VFD98_01935 [Terracidiphilus sp.]|nr:hypothetical protein [Terracidiphilus sp.]